MKSIKSAKIYHFPRFNPVGFVPSGLSGHELNSRNGSKQANRVTGWQKILHWPISIAWLWVAMLWPLLNWIGALDVVSQWVRALYYSNTPAIHAILQAGLHTACYLLVSAFVYLYRPKVF